MCNLVLLHVKGEKKCENLRRYKGWCLSSRLPKLMWKLLCYILNQTCLTFTPECDANVIPSFK